MSSFELQPEKSLSSAPPAAGGVQAEVQLNSRLAQASAQNFFKPGAEIHALAHAAVVPGAPEPISPIIQMIMRMPGHIGLLNSFFEALKAMFLPQLDFLPHLDPSLFGHHAFEAGNSIISKAAEHAPIDLAALPASAHIFDGMHLTGINGSDMAKHLGNIDLQNRALEVSGTPDIGKPMYEGAGVSAAASNSAGAAARTSDGILAGPSMSDHGITTHLAGAHRIMSHSLFERPSTGVNPSSLASNPPTATPTVAQTVSPTTNPYTGNALNVNGNPLAQRLSAAPALGEIKYGVPFAGKSAMNASFHLPSSAERLLGNGSLGPSGAVSGDLGSKQILAMNDSATTGFKPTSGSTADQLASPDSHAQNSAAHSAEGQATELRANALRLDGKANPELIKDHSVSAKHPHAATTAPLPKNHHPDHKAASTTPTLEHVQVVAPKPATVANAQAAQTLPTNTVSGEATTYTIRSGDCLWNIAKDKLGDATRWQEIYKLNADTLGSNPSLIHQGSNLQLPSSNEIASHADKYTVRAGDNLWNISKQVLGGGDKWGQLYKLNSDAIGSNPSLILPGQELSIQSPDTVAANPSSASSASSAPSAISDGVASSGNQVATNSLEQAANTSQTASTPSTESAASTQSPNMVPSAPGSDAAASSTKPVLSGPGGAQAAATTQADPNSDSIVSPSLAPDLSFLSQTKR